MAIEDAVVGAAIAKADAKKKYEAPLVRALSRQRVPIMDRGGFGAAANSTMSDGVAVCMNSRYQFVSPISAYSLAPTYVNYMNSGGGEVDGPNPITVRAAIEWASGLILPLRFNGTRNAVIEPGGTATPDPLGITILAGQSYWVRTLVSVNAGEKWPLLASRFGSAGITQHSEYTDRTLSGTISDAAIFRGYGPVQILAHPNTPGQPTIGLPGDSIYAGSNDGDTGWPTRWLNGKFCMQNVSYSNSRLNHWGLPSTSNWRRAPLLDPCTDILFGLAVNDFITGQVTTLAGIQERFIAAWSRWLAQGKRVHLSTILPATTSSNGWTNSAGQTPLSWESLRVAANDWIRTTALSLGITTVIDAADVAETSRNSGIWKSTGGAWVADGLHANAHGAQSIASALPPAPATLNLPVGV